MKIAIDIDGVLADFHRAFALLIIGKWPEKGIADSYQPASWGYTELLTPEEFKAAFDSFLSYGDIWMELDPLIGAEQLKGFMQSLRWEGIDIYYCTARPTAVGFSTIRQTNMWLEEQKIWHSNTSLLVCEHGWQKRILYENLGVQFSLDDKQEIVEDCNKIPGHRAFVLNRRWNTDAVALPRLYSVAEYLDIVIHEARKR